MSEIDSPLVILFLTENERWLRRTESDDAAAVSLQGVCKVVQLPSPLVSNNSGGTGVNGYEGGS